VIQYDPEADDWLTIGTLSESRLEPDVIDVPIEFCDRLGVGEEDITVEAEEIALIIGGVWIPELPGDRVLSSVEIFGCDGRNTIEVEDYPITGTYLPGAVFLADKAEVLVCGGFGCPGGAPRCSDRLDCHTFSLITGQWTDAPQMNAARFNYLMALAPDAEAGESKELKPVVLGSGPDTEILDDGEWRPYLPLEYSSWQGSGCMVQNGDFVYVIQEEIVVLDLTRWSFTSLGDAPTNFARPRQCTYTIIDGQAGIFLRFGYWFSLVTETWHKKTR